MTAKCGTLNHVCYQTNCGGAVIQKIGYNRKIVQKWYLKLSDSPSEFFLYDNEQQMLDAAQAKNVEVQYE